MDVAITAVVAIKGKDGREWTKICFLKTNGETGDKFFAKDKFDLSAIEPVTLPESAYSTKLSFDERGNLVDIQ